jgi:hypothetical protein
MLVVLIGAAAAHVCAQAPARVRWQNILDQPAAWYASSEARSIADSVLRFQRESGGWPKDVDMLEAPKTAPPARPDATIDNGATTTQIRLLSQVPGNAYRAAAIRGIDYLLAAQYPNGGWPQFYPLRDDYSRHITFNDNAMIDVVTIMEDVARAKTPFDYVDAVRRSKAAEAVRRAVDVVLASQVVVNGTLTAWCAQHDAVTLEPRPARAYEHVSLSGAETTGIVRFLMRQPRTPEIERAVDAAVSWLRAVRQPDGQWARFYQIGTNKPIFSGRDGVIRYQLAEVEEERREGYAWLGTWPRNLVDKEYDRWKSAR